MVLLEYKQDFLKFFKGNRRIFSILVYSFSTFVDSPHLSVFLLDWSNIFGQPHVKWMQTLFKTTKRIIDKNMVMAMRNFQPWCRKMFWNVLDARRTVRFFKLASTQTNPYSYPLIRTVSNVKDASVRVILSSFYRCAFPRGYRYSRRG